MQSQDISYTQGVLLFEGGVRKLVTGLAIAWAFWSRKSVDILQQWIFSQFSLRQSRMQSPFSWQFQCFIQALYGMEWTSDERPWSFLHVGEDGTSPSSILLQAGDLPSAIVTRPWSERSSAPLLPPFDLVPALRWSYSYPSHVLMICCLAMFSSIVGVTHHCSLTYSTVECTV